MSEGAEGPIRRQMSEDHDPEECEACIWLEERCPMCGARHYSYEDAKSCQPEPQWRAEWGNYVYRRNGAVNKLRERRRQ